MTMNAIRLAAAAVLTASCAFGQNIDPFPQPIAASEGVIRVGIADFATVPQVGGEAARMMLLVNEPGSRRLFANDMRGPLYTVGYDGKSVTPYVDINAPTWGVKVQSQGRERGFQSFALHPEFNRPGTRGYGKFYTYTDSSNMEPKPDYVPAGGGNTHADKLPAGGQDAIHRILFTSGGTAKTLMQLIKEKNAGATRADLRFGTGPDNRVFLLNKQDGVIREILR